MKKVENMKTETSVELEKLNRGIGENGSNVKKKVEKDQWGNEIEFLLSCITLSVGLGNVWR